MRSSPLGLTVLSLLHLRPLHPYGIQRLIKQWGKDQVVNVSQRASLYRTIDRLLAAGLIAVRETSRDQQYPERTVYEVTGAGRAATREWLREMLVAPRAEYPEFPAALSFTMMLLPQEVEADLSARATQVRARLGELESAAEGARQLALPRVTMLEDEYRRAVLIAELNWLDAVTSDLRSGALTWDFETLAALARTTDPT
ncbi:PadR family transcriptional regulator [Streptomyces yokosukanensis]|uniref:PadR family transcriptional regulator n=1 Tax=Streptomyces yokosukanensis TaxID=67386 RepID=A0A101NUQ9_9ACTN|nr:PadR family transcriptional regulator [Streptomyces yokosukanensis]KUM99574.1 PadR family transcriptional regulator [Streptomyces yokosukanensis]